MVNSLSFIVMGAYVPVTFIVVWLISKYGLRCSIIVGLCCLVTSGWLRYISACISYFAWPLLVIGQLFTAVGMPFLLNATTELAENWFGEKERSIATGIGALSNVLGNAAVMIMAPSIVASSDGSEIPLLLLIEAAACTIVSIPTAIFFQSHAPTPPTTTATHALTLGADGFIHQLKVCFFNMSFMLLCVGFACVYASFNALPTLLSDILSPYGYTDNDVGACGAILLGVGVFAAVCAGFLIDMYRSYKMMLIIGVIGIVSSMLFLVLEVRENNINALYVAHALLGFFALPCLPVSLELAVELTYPINENVSNGFLIMSGNALSLILIVVMSALRDKQTNLMTTSLWVMFAVASLSFVLVPFVKPNYKRLQAEQAISVI